MLEDGIDEGTVAEQVRAVLPQGLSVHSAAMRTQNAKEMLAGLEQGLLLATVLAVVLGICIILNTFLMNVSERRPQLAILRAMGAREGKSSACCSCEGLILGVLGTVLGCLFGIGGGYLLMRRSRGCTSPRRRRWSSSGFLSYWRALGPTVAVVGAAVPALLTAQINPAEAMRPLCRRRRAARRSGSLGPGSPLWR